MTQHKTECGMLLVVAASACFTGVASAQEWEQLRCQTPTVFPDKGDDTGASACGTITQGQTVLVEGNLVLNPECDYSNVQFKIRSPNTTLDCAGAVLDGSGLPTEDAPRTRAIYVVGYETEPPVRNVTIRNCFVQGYEQAVVVRHILSEETKQEIRDLYWGDMTISCEDEVDPEIWVAYRDGTADCNRPGGCQDVRTARPPRNLAAIEEVESRLRQTAPGNVVVENVHVRDVAHVPFYIYRYATGVKLRGVSARSNDGGPGVYFDSGSAHNEVTDACFWDLAREAVAIDSSFGNTVEASWFDGGKGGVFIYKNSYEKPCSQLPRAQHAAANRIRNNIFRGHRGVVVASRATRHYQVGQQADPIVYQYPDDSVLHEDFAEGTLVENNLFVVDAGEVGLRLLDDAALVLRNDFYTQTGGTGITVGASQLEVSGQSIYGTGIVQNWFASGLDATVQFHTCTHGSHAEYNERGNGELSVPELAGCAIPTLHPAKLMPILMAF